VLDGIVVREHLALDAPQEQILERRDPVEIVATLAGSRRAADPTIGKVVLLALGNARGSPAFE
jgi:hypothetical protein